MIKMRVPAPRKMSCLLAALCLLLALSNSCVKAADTESSRTIPPAAPLKGLKTLKVEVKVSRDVSNELAHIGAPAPMLGAELAELAHKKLKESGLSTAAIEGKDALLRIIIHTDVLTDEFTVSLTFSDMVSLKRDPQAEFRCILWKVSGHPESDESGPIKDTLNDLMDRFIADVIEANKGA